MQTEEFLGCLFAIPERVHVEHQLYSREVTGRFELFTLSPPDDRTGRRGAGNRGPSSRLSARTSTAGLSVGRGVLYAAVSRPRLLLEYVHVLDPLAYGVGVVERDAGALRQVAGTSGIPGGGHHPGLDAAMVACPGVDFLHGPVAHGPGVILTLYGYALTHWVHNHVDALIPCPTVQHHPMPHGPEEVCYEHLEPGPIHGTDRLEAPGELHGGRGHQRLPQMPDYPHDGTKGPYQKGSTQ